MEMSVNKQMKMQIVIRIVAAAPVLGAIFFWPAGTFNYWEVWVYLAILFVTIIGITVYFLLSYLLPGFDHRFGWSDVPAWLVLAGDAVVIVGFVFLFQVFKVNSYAARVVVVEEEQEVITTGPYALVRHPMYLSVVLVYVFSPLALGSFWAMIPTAALILLLAVRILNEEKVLLRDLKGYGEYLERVRWRLIPGVW
jgi:protein-S-isoprenylcysteine O-methyltransferase Ste14